MGNIKQIKKKRVILRLLIVAGIAAAGWQGWDWMTGHFRVVVPGVLYRAGQPNRRQLAGWIDRYGIKTVVNLRGPLSPYSEMEEEVAQEKGVEIDHVQLSAYYQMGSQRLGQILDIIEQAARPILVHCRHGNDRSGTVSGLILWLGGYGTYSEAREQAWVLPGPWNHKKGPDHISQLYDVYERWCRENGQDYDSTAQFKHWARTVYHPHYYYAQIEGPHEVEAGPGEAVSLEYVVKNCSREAIPAGLGEKRFELFSVLRDSGRTMKLKAVTALGQEDIAPGEQIVVSHVLTAPKEAGRYELVIDVREVDGASFGYRGSPVLTGVLTVR